MSVRLMISFKKTFESASCAIHRSTQIRCLSSANITRKRMQLFENEQQRQRDNVGRIEKIEVKYQGVPEDQTLVMNKDISTPYNCAQHFNEAIVNNSALALVNGNILWDMHRPLKESCTLQLLNFKINDPQEVNQAFWRTCSFIMGAVLQKTFKSEAGLQLYSFPKPIVKSGSFVHDIVLNEKNWKPSLQDFRALGIEMAKFSRRNHKIERLEVNYDLALQMFEDNPYKREQLPSIANKNDGIITVYRVDDHIDISKGPMIGSTSFIGQTKLSSVHKLSKEEGFNLYRVQGIALPVGFSMSYYAFNILNERAKKLNVSGLQNFANTSENQTSTSESNQFLVDEHNSTDKPILQQRI